MHQVFYLSKTEFQKKLAFTPLFGSVASSPFGPLAIRKHGDSICALGFQKTDSLDEWPYSLPYQQDPQTAEEVIDSILKDKPLSLLLVGTSFQQSVWKALLKIPKGKVKSYQDIAIELGDAKKSRAVGSAVGKNLISWVVPCHRVLPKHGGVGNYHWGSSLKAQLLKSENYEPTNR